MIQLDFDAPDATARSPCAPTDVGYSQHDGAERGRLGTRPSSRRSAARTRSCIRPRGRMPTTTARRSTWGAARPRASGCDNTRGPSRELRPAVQLVPDDRAAMVERVPLAGVPRATGARSMPPSTTGRRGRTPIRSGTTRSRGRPPGGIRPRSPSRKASPGVPRSDGPLLRRRRRRLEPPDVRRATAGRRCSWRCSRCCSSCSGRSLRMRVAALAAVRARPPPGPRADPARVGAASTATTRAST